MEFLKKHHQKLINWYLCLNFIGWTLYQLHNAWINENLNFVEISFAVQNLVLIFIILIRRDYRAVDKNYFHQAIAIIAFFSGIAFMGQDSSGSDLTQQISLMVVAFANILGLITIFNLGRSFGILIAYRKVQNKGLYSIIRHPMYATDILLRFGFVISHTNWLTILIFVLSTACYIYRALLEEAFLSHQESYKDYKEKTKYRFIPFVF